MGLRRLDPALLVHTARVAGQRRLVAQASAARPPLMLKDPRALAALAALPGEFDRDSAAAAWDSAGIGEAERDQLWEAFEAAGLFVDRESGPPSWWDEFGWREAHAYHRATRDYPFIQMDEPGALASDTGRMQSYRSEAPPPPLYQHLGDRPGLELPRKDADTSHDERLEEMDPGQRLGLDGVALLLDVCFGERAQVVSADGGRFLLKSIPSGGARHPTEVFLAAFDLDGIPAGVYHYGVEGHLLEPVSDEDQREAFESATFDLLQRSEKPPAALLVFTSVVDRAMWRYRDPRSFRAILVDVGHAVTAYRQVARTLGFKTFAYQRFRDREIADLLGIDRFAQPPLYVGTLIP